MLTFCVSTPPPFLVQPFMFLDPLLPCCSKSLIPSPRGYSVIEDPVDELPSSRALPLKSVATQTPTTSLQLQTPPSDQNRQLEMFAVALKLVQISDRFGLHVAHQRAEMAKSRSVKCQAMDLLSAFMKCTVTLIYF